MVGVATGVSGVYFTWKSGKEAKTHAETVARDQLTHALLLAREQREQQRMETAYIQLLVEAERTGNWANLVFSMLFANPPFPGPPSPDQWAPVAAHVRAFGSARVKELMQEWRDVVDQLTELVRLITPPGISVEGGDERPEARREFIESRAKERTARLALADQVAIELQTPNENLMFTDPKKFPMKVMQDD